MDTRTEEERKLVNDRIEEIAKEIDDLVNYVYLMGYKRGLQHDRNSPKFP